MKGISAPDSLNVVSFFAAGHRFAVEAAQVRTQVTLSVAATTVEHLLGLPDHKAGYPPLRRILLIKGCVADTAVIVSEPVELRSLKIDSIYPLPPLIAARNTLLGLRGLAMETDGVTVLVDLVIDNLS